jgi:hypothetical protein
VFLVVVIYSLKSFDLGVLKPFKATAQVENNNIYGKKARFSSGIRAIFAPAKIAGLT